MGAGWVVCSRLFKNLELGELGDGKMIWRGLTTEFGIWITIHAASRNKGKMHWTLMKVACFDPRKQASVASFLIFSGVLLTAWIIHTYHWILAFVILGPGKTTGGVRVEGYDIRREACVTYVPCDVCMMKPASSDRRRSNFFSQCLHATVPQKLQ